MNEDNTNPSVGTPPVTPGPGTAVPDASSLPSAPDASMIPVTPGPTEVSTTPIETPAAGGLPPVTPAAAELPSSPPPVAEIPSAPPPVSSLPTAPIDISGPPVAPVTAAGEKKHGAGYFAMIALLFLTILGLIGFIVYTLVLKKPVVASYADCVAAGYPVQESFPPKCTTPEGEIFTQQIENEEDTEETEETEDEAQVPVEKDITVYFSKDPESYDDPTVTSAVTRTTDRVDAETFALEQLIVGPTDAEKAQKLFTPLAFGGLSNCAGKDFTLTIDAEKEATVKFCKSVDSAGVLSDGRIVNVINETLGQFTTINKNDIVLLTRDNNCFGDQSGANTCID